MSVSFCDSLKKKKHKKADKKGYSADNLIVNNKSYPKSIAKANGMAPIDAPTTRTIWPVPWILPTWSRPKYLGHIYPNNAKLKALLIPKITEYIIAKVMFDEKVIKIKDAVVTRRDVPITLCVLNLSKSLPANGINIIIVIMVGINNAAASLLGRLKYWFNIVTWKKWRAVTREDIEKKENDKI